MLFFPKNGTAQKRVWLCYSNFEKEILSLYNLPPYSRYASFLLHFIALRDKKDREHTDQE